MTEKKQDELLDHNYDGIQEYDNDLPVWWVWLFLITILFAIAYHLYFDFGPGTFAVERLPEKMAAWEEKQDALQEKLQPKGEESREQLLALVNDQEMMSVGKEVFDKQCAACHLQQGQGLIGPNLTDDYWIHGGDITDIKRVIVEGVVEKGMLAWQGVLTPKEISAVSAYIWTLHGTNPPNPKEPQGELIKREDLGQ